MKLRAAIKFVVSFGLGFVAGYSVCLQQSYGISSAYDGALLAAPTAPPAPEVEIREDCLTEKAQSDTQVERKDEEDEEDTTVSSSKKDASNVFSGMFPVTMNKYMVGMGQVETLEFAQNIDLGVPLDNVEGEGQSHSLLLYSSKSSLPNDHQLFDKGNKNNTDDRLPLLAWPQATQNCEDLTVILAPLQSYHPRQCMLLVPQKMGAYHTFHYGRYNAGMRPKKVAPGSKRNKKLIPSTDMSFPLTRLGRYVHNHFDSFALKSDDEERAIADGHFKILQLYMQHRDQMKQDVAPILQTVVDQTSNSVIILTTNFGQVDLLMNLVCSAQAHNLTHVLKHVFVYALDEKTRDVCQNMGLATYYNKDMHGSTSLKGSNAGSPAFGALTIAKFVVSHLTSDLGYNFLYQDVDIVWYRNVLDYFPQKHMDFDMVFADDANRANNRYVPYYANSGLYFARNNVKTRHFFDMLILSGGMMNLRYYGDQNTINQLLGDHTALHGLRVKSLAHHSRDGLLFLGGYHFHYPSKESRAAFAAARNNTQLDGPYSFHVYWTTDKKEKYKNLRKVGEWRFKGSCAGNPHDISDPVTSCCIS